MYLKKKQKNFDIKRLPCPTDAECTTHQNETEMQLYEYENYD